MLVSPKEFDWWKNVACWENLTLSLELSVVSMSAEHRYRADAGVLYSSGLLSVLIVSSLVVVVFYFG